MRWGPGSLRIWIVLSALWVASVVYVQKPKTFQFWESAYQLSFGGKPVIELNAAKDKAALANELTAIMRTQRPDVDAAELEQDRDKILAMLRARHQVVMDEAKTAWLLTITPPLALLGFGLCICWIARGFRSRM
jgi:hypothetical protein